MVGYLSDPGPATIEFRPALYDSHHFEDRAHSRQVKEEINILGNNGNGVVCRPETQTLSSASFGLCI
jgi:hypothetical protein